MTGLSQLSAMCRNARGGIRRKNRNRIHKSTHVLATMPWVFHRRRLVTRPVRRNTKRPKRRSCLASAASSKIGNSGKPSSAVNTCRHKNKPCSADGDRHTRALQFDKRAIQPSIRRWESIVKSNAPATAPLVMISLCKSSSAPGIGTYLPA